MIARLALMAIVVLACSGPTSTPTVIETAFPLPSPSGPTPEPQPTPAPISQEPPPTCSDATLAYDTNADRMLLTTCVNQLDPAAHERVWSWDGAEWWLISDDGPPPMVVTSAAWNSYRDKLVRYGGLPMNSNDCVAQTWEWDGVNWAQPPAPDNQLPQACDHMKMAYDPSYGGVLVAGGGKLKDLSAQTWTWDGTTWSWAALDGTPRRAHHGLAFFPGSDRMLLYGGIDNTQIFGDLWSWDETTWAQIDVPGPGPRSHFGFAASPAEVLFFGGASGTNTFGTLEGDTWIYADGTWTQLDIPGVGPSPRGSPGLAYDESRKTFVLYGGFDSTGAELGDTWEFNSAAWSCVDRC